MIKKVKDVLTSQNFKSISQLAVGFFAAQIITVAVSPISTRLYSAEQLGTYTLILTLVSIFGPVICGKYDYAIVSAENEKEAMELITGSIFFLMIFSLIITAGYNVYLYSNPKAAEAGSIYAYLLIAILIVTGFINILTSYNNRHKEFKTIASVNALRSAVQNAGLVAFGLFKLGSLGLLLSQLLGMLMGLKKQGQHLYRNKALLKEVRISAIKETLVKYRRQPLYSMPAHFINSTSYSMINFFISGLFGMKVFGYYSLAYRILGLPLSLISMNVSIVFFRRASEEKTEMGNYYGALKQITLFLAGISIFMVVILIILGPYMFKLVFGDGWEMSGVFARILAPMYGFRFIVSALTPALIISGEQRLELIIQSAFMLSSILCYLISKSLELDMNVFLTLITITYSVIYIVLYAFIHKLSKKEMGGIECD